MSCEMAKKYLSQMRGKVNCLVKDTVSKLTTNRLGLFVDLHYRPWRISIELYNIRC